MSEDQLSMLKERLYSETNKLKLRFAKLMFSLQKDLEKRLSMEEVVNILVFCDKNFDGVLAECTSFSTVFRKVRHFVSFFDYDLLEHLIDEYGSDAIKKELDKYNGYLRSVVLLNVPVMHLRSVKMILQRKCWSLLRTGSLRT